MRKRDLMMSKRRACLTTKKKSILTHQGSHTSVPPGQTLQPGSCIITGIFAGPARRTPGGNSKALLTRLRRHFASALTREDHILFFFLSLEESKGSCFNRGRHPSSTEIMHPGCLPPPTVASAELMPQRYPNLPSRSFAVKTGEA